MQLIITMKCVKYEYNRVSGSDEYNFFKSDIKSKNRE